MMLLRPTAQEADSRFLWYFLNSHYAKAYVQLIATSSTYPNIKWGTYGDMPVPIPPLGEQQRIVDILDKAMAQIQRAMDAIATERRETTALRAAVLRQALDPATHPSWPMVKLGNDAFFEIQAGGTPDSGEPKFWNGTINWVTLEDLPQGQAISEIKTTHRRITEEGLKRSAATLLPVGTVVVSSRATIGRVGIALVPLATNQGFKNVVVKNPSEALSRFVAYAILNLTDQMQELASGGTFKEISRRHVADLVIPLPPIEAQQRIADILDKAVEQVDRINGTLDEQERQLTALRSSILDAAFRGEL
jgi:type I restriction enzyme M protein